MNTRPCCCFAWIRLGPLRPWPLDGCVIAGIQIFLLEALHHRRGSSAKVGRRFSAFKRNIRMQSTTASRAMPKESKAQQALGGASLVDQADERLVVHLDV